MTSRLHPGQIHVIHGRICDVAVSDTPAWQEWKRGKRQACTWFHCAHRNITSAAGPYGRSNFENTRLAIYSYKSAATAYERDYEKVRACIKSPQQADSATSKGGISTGPVLYLYLRRHTDPRNSGPGQERHSLRRHNLHQPCPGFGEHIPPATTPQGLLIEQYTPAHCFCSPTDSTNLRYILIPRREQAHKIWTTTRHTTAPISVRSEPGKLRVDEHVWSSKALRPVKFKKKNNRKVAVSMLGTWPDGSIIGTIVMPAGATAGATCIPPP